jgi:hypothetical protein
MAKKPKVKDTSKDVDPMALRFPDIGGDEPENKGEDDEVRTQLASIAAQLASISDENKSLRDANLRLMATAPSAPGNVSSTPSVPAKMSFDGMPDPVEKPTEYAAELNRRISAQLALERDAERQQTQAQQQQSARVQGLWAGFSSQYGEYAKDQNKVEYAAYKLAEKMKSRGVDMERYMFTTQDQFFRDLKEEMVSIFGKLDGEEDDALEPADRTTGLPGGSVPNAKGSFKTDAEKSTFVADLQKMQRTSGFF